MLQFIQDNARIYGKITDKDGVTIRSYNYICYGQCLHTEGEAHKHKNAKFYSFVFPDSLSVINKSTDMSNWFIDKMVELGVFRNATWQWIDKEVSTYPSYVNPTLYNRLFEYKVDVTTVTPQEMFFIGQIVRVINTAPRTIIDFYEILKLEPDLEEFTCFVLAHAMSATQDKILESGGNSLIPHYMGLLTGFTVADVHKHIDANVEAKVYKPINKSKFYGFLGGLEQKFYTNPEYKHDTIWRQTPTTRRYSKEYLDTFFNKTAFLKYHVKNIEERYL